MTAVGQAAVFMTRKESRQTRAGRAWQGTLKTIENTDSYNDGLQAPDL